MTGSDYAKDIVILFDLDQTLVDAIKIYDKAFGLVFWEVYGVDCSLYEIDFAGKSTPEVFWAGCKIKGVLREEYVEKLPGATKAVSEAFVKFASRPGAKIRVLAGAEALLGLLSKRKVLMGVVTGSPITAAIAILKKSSLEKYFAFVFGGDKAESKEELASAALKRAGEILGKTPRTAVIVGDSVREAEVAKALGLRFVGVATGNNTKEELEAEGFGKAFADLRNTRKVLREILG